MGGGGKSAESGASEDLVEIAKQFFKETTPVRQELTGQFLEALTTGGSGARMPIISKAVESSQRATSKTMRSTEENLARGGLAGTPFGAQIRAQTQQQGEFATSQVEPNMIMQILQQIPGFVTGSSQVTTSGMGQAAGAQAQQTGAFGNLVSGMMSPFKFNFG